MVEEDLLSVTEPSQNGEVAERRQFVRHDCSWTVSCYTVLPGDGSRWPGTICDVSTGGLSLVACRPFKEGEIIAVELVRPIDGVREKLFGRVRRAVSQDGVWIAGCRFVNRLTDGELDRLCSTKTPVGKRRAEAGE